MSAQAQAAMLGRLIWGFEVTQAIHVAVTLGIPDRLADQARTADALASDTGTHAQSLYRLMRALAAVGIFHESSDGAFSLTETGTLLRSDVPGSLAPVAAHHGLQYFWDAWAHLGHSVRTGETGFKHRHGVGAWEYRAHHPTESAIFNRFMAGQTRAGIDAITAAYDFSAFKRVVDVGGGNGTLLAALLSRNPGMHGVLFDQPHVVSEAADVLATAGVAGRCEIVPGDFFQSVPQAGDAYVLKLIIHDWDDADAVRILETCRRAVAPQGRILVIDQVIAPPNEGLDGKLLDLNMMVMLGGQERTAEEFDALLARGGFKMTAIVPTRSPMNVIEAIPA